MNNTLEKFWIIIPAAGIGNRYVDAASTAKQYITLGAKTILSHTINIFLTQPWVEKIVVAIAEHDKIFPTLDCAKHPKVTTVIGGESRMASVYAALCSLDAQAAPQDWILVHDAVRPCLHEQDLCDLVATLKDDPIGGILASPVVDTVKQVGENTLKTLDRTGLWQALTPQMFRLKVLKQAIERCIASNLAVTDEASALEQCVIASKIVAAQYPNPKLTYIKDKHYIDFLIQNKNRITECV